MVPHAIAKYNIGKHHALMRKIKKSEETKYGEFIEFDDDDDCTRGRILEYYKFDDQALRCYEKCADYYACIMGWYFSARLQRHNGELKLDPVRLKSAAMGYLRIAQFSFRGEFPIIKKIIDNEENFVISHIDEHNMLNWLNCKSLLLSQEFRKSPTLSRFAEHTSCIQFAKEEYNHTIHPLTVFGKQKKSLISEYQLILSEILQATDLSILIARFLV